MTPQEFVRKWELIRQKETAVAQSHFNDVCRLAGHLTPLEYDPAGKNFSFETQTVKPGGTKGFADVFFREHFIWEYKGPHKDLGKAYQQLQLYREDLQNPPLLITSDIQTIVIHTNFNNYPTVKHAITLDDILDGIGVEKLRWAFFHPEKFVPSRTQEQITKATADTFLGVANKLKEHWQLTGEEYTPEQLAHFLARLLFCLFAEDMKLLPNQVFTEMVQAQAESYSDIHAGLRNLFREMRSGGAFGYYRIRYFDGSLFDDDFVPDLPPDVGGKLMQAAQQDWSQVDPSIFGTLFERIIDDSKRAQLGAHYTSEADIMLIVEPVLMEPLRRRWDEVRRQADRMLRGGEETSEAHPLLSDFAAELDAVRVLDPACGSGNFLYVALRQLLDLQKQVIAFAARRELPPIELTIGPEQLYGIEINPYAHQLAQITTWIGYLQWRNENGFGDMNDPILRSLHNIQHMDAILAYDADGNPVEPEWPSADVIIGNPPFLGAKKIIGEFGQEYADNLRIVYENRLPGFSDLVVYWFERARVEIEKGKTDRAGLIATNSIGMGTNLPVLKQIKETGDIFMAWDDRDWILDGAAVRVAIVAFDDGSEQKHQLNGRPIPEINADLTAGLDLTKAKTLNDNLNWAFIGTQKSGPFDISHQEAAEMIKAKNRNSLSNADVVLPWVNGSDIVQRPKGKSVIYFPEGFTEKEASEYQEPFEYLRDVVIANRKAVHFKDYPFWLHWRPRPAFKDAVEYLQRYIITPRVSKHRVFVWMDSNVIPDSATVAITRDDDFFFGLLHSRLHEIWALRLGTSLEDRPRYTPTTTFETFPFPWPPGQELGEDEDERVAEIAHWARALVQWRDAWLNPPRTGLYAGMGNAYGKMVKKRTLTNLYNGLVYYRQTVKSGEPFIQAAFDKGTRHSVSRAEIQEVDDIHTALDHAVLDAYGWPYHLSDEEILERLLALNLERAEAQEES